MTVRTIQILNSERTNFLIAVNSTFEFGFAGMKLQKKKAVALEYGAQESPTLIAKGQDDLALEIIEEAKKHEIFIAEDRDSSALCRRLAYPRKFQKSCIMRLL